MPWEDWGVCVYFNFPQNSSEIFINFENCKQLANPHKAISRMLASKRIFCLPLSIYGVNCLSYFHRSCTYETLLIFNCTRLRVNVKPRNRPFEKTAHFWVGILNFLCFSFHPLARCALYKFIFHIYSPSLQRERAKRRREWNKPR
jgi:hypothetical protein